MICNHSNIVMLVLFHDGSVMFIVVYIVMFHDSMLLLVLLDSHDSIVHDSNVVHDL